MTSESTRESPREDDFDIYKDFIEIFAEIDSATIERKRVLKVRGKDK
jgi:hypothetical protein